MIPMNDNVNLPTIIYVEDNHGDALLLREALLERKHQVNLVIIENGAKALHYFEIKAKVRDIPPPHCILLDTHLPIVTGLQLISFIRGTAGYNDTPVYIFASESDYAALRATIVVSKESFLIKPNTWERFLDLADLLMKSAEAKADNVVASALDSKPEVHAEGALRLHKA
jgi:CheY-like chemotaxis protein